MNRKIDPRTNVPTVASLATAFVTSLVGWAVATVPESIPGEVITSGHALLVVLAAVAVGKLAQHFTWAQDSVDTLIAAEDVIWQAEQDG